MIHSLLLLSIFSANLAFGAIKPKTVANLPVVAASATPSPVAGIPDRHLSYYEIGKTDSPPIYTQKIQYQKSPNGELTAKVTVYDTKGAVVYTETTVSKGWHLISQIGDHYQSKRHLEVEVKDDRVCLRTGPLAGDPHPTETPKENCDKLPENFLTGPVCEDFIADHLDELMADKTVYARFGVLDVREFIGFKFWKSEMTKINNRDVIVIGLKPSSIFLRLLVNTIYIYFDVKDRKLVKYVGRTPLWIPQPDGDLKPLDAELIFN